MARVVVDASIILAGILPDEKVIEPYKTYFHLFRQKKLEFVAPNILKSEVANGLRSAVLQKRFLGSLVEKIFDRFLEMIIGYSEIDYPQTLSLAIKHNLSFYDASYLYLAKLKKCKLLTLDSCLEKMAEKEVWKLQKK